MQTLKVGARTKPASTAAAISGYLKTLDAVEVVAMGRDATYNATLAIVNAKEFMRPLGLAFDIDISIVDLYVENKEKTAIKWILSKKNIIDNNS